MIRKILAIAALVPVVLFQSNAIAAEKITFAGGYLGVYGGGAGAGFSGVIDSSEIPEEDTQDTETFGYQLKNKGAYGLYLGYNAVRDGLLFGLEADLGSGNMTGFARDEDGTDYARHKIMGTASFRGRLGVLASENTLLYATGGIGIINSKLTAYNNMDTNDAAVKSVRLNSVTYVAGLGIEHKFNADLSFRLEGLYFAPGRKHTFTDEALHEDMDSGDYVQVDGLYQVRAGLAYHF